MTPVGWSPRSLQDLQSIKAWIAKDAPRTAAEFVSRLVLTTEAKLAALPERGRPVPEDRHRKLRQIPFGYYRIVYRIRPSGVEIAAVISAKHQFDRTTVDRITQDLEALP